MKISPPPTTEKLTKPDSIATWQWLKWFYNAYKFLRGVEDNLHALNIEPVVGTPHIRHTPFGVFYSTVTQTAAAINTAYPITYNTTDFTDGIELVSNSKIYARHNAVYNFQFSVELTKAPAALAQVWIWARLNGTDIIYSTGRVSLSGSSSDKVASWNYVIQMADNDYFELIWATDDTNCQIKAETATAFAPAVPSVLLTVTDNVKAVPY